MIKWKRDENCDSLWQSDCGRFEIFPLGPALTKYGTPAKPLEFRLLDHLTNFGYYFEKCREAKARATERKNGKTMMPLATTTRLFRHT